MAQREDTDIERQVDDHLVSLFGQNTEALKWLTDQIGVASGHSLDGVLKSCSKSPSREFSSGQTDIGILLFDGPQTIWLLIENKVMSPFTDNQPQRYQEECAGLNGRQGTRAICVLICPSRYAETSRAAKLFDAVIRYEDIDSRFGPSAVLDKAIARCNDGWIAEEIPAVSDNFDGYGGIVDNEYPLLKMKTKRGNKPTQSRTIYFDETHAGLSRPYLPKVILNHQWQEGRTKVLFRGWGIYRHWLEPIMAKDVEDIHIRVDPNQTKSLGLMLPTPVIDNHGGFEAQVGAMLKGLDQVELLRQFVASNTDMTKKWAALVFEQDAMS